MTDGDNNFWGVETGHSDIFAQKTEIYLLHSEKSSKFAVDFVGMPFRLSDTCEHSVVWHLQTRCYHISLYVISYTEI